MRDTKLTNAEKLFADIIWKNEPVSSSELVKLAAGAFGWKKSTTYTILKRLTQKEIFVNEKGTVRSLISKDELNSIECEKLIDETFLGSVPAFLEALTKRKPLSEKDSEKIRDILNKKDR